ncbi:MAG: HD-GYP domain-containing protein [Deltaproteobacteria bacterium]|jgi:HD-GYP domain-containing protein (c-di-GMP phosphodiesterase class II)|nr:HD-GYP domain-containing protein [Deltaproteobacteria bacterium]
MTEKRIPTNQLVPGMYIINKGVRWKENPYLYSTEGLATAAVIDKILADGYTEVFVDLDRSEIKENNSAAEAESVLKHIDNEEDFVAPESSLAAEMPVAKALYAESMEMSKSLMDGIRRGDKIDLHKGKGLVKNLLDSITRNQDAMLTLCKLRDADEYTYSHTVNVAVMGLAFARHMNFPPSLSYEVGMAGLFHDLGKAMIPIEVLNAPRELTEAEFSIMRRHPYLGYEYVKKTPGFTQETLMGIYDHHERFDGKGYPRGLPGDQISQSGRVLAIVDVYDALSSRRPYKRAMLPYKVLGIMYQMRCADFFPGYMEHFIRMLGVYPVGSVVEVSGGFIGVVTASNPAKPAKPKVMLMLDKDNKRVTPEEVDTSLEGAPTVARALHEGESPLDPGKVLNAK